MRFNTFMLITWSQLQHSIPPETKYTTRQQMNEYELATSTTLGTPTCDGIFHQWDAGFPLRAPSLPSVPTAATAMDSQTRTNLTTWMGRLELMARDRQ
jgi:hypothetical protein